MKSSDGKVWLKGESCAEGRWLGDRRRFGNDGDDLAKGGDGGDHIEPGFGSDVGGGS